MDWLMDGLIDWLMDGLIDWLMDGLIDWWIDWLIDGFYEFDLCCFSFPLLPIIQKKFCRFYSASRPLCINKVHQRTAGARGESQALPGRPDYTPDVFATLARHLRAGRATSSAAHCQLSREGLGVLPVRRGYRRLCSCKYIGPAHCGGGGERLFFYCVAQIDEYSFIDRQCRGGPRTRGLRAGAGKGSHSGTVSMWVWMLTVQLDRKILIYDGYYFQTRFFFSPFHVGWEGVLY